MTPKIGIDFRKGSCAKSKFYSVLSASRRTRGAVVSDHFLPDANGPEASLPADQKRVDIPKLNSCTSSVSSLRTGIA
ncbi:MAG: hypothetical protein E5X83_06120 [Mesorhizobium sp.]|nr:MAG: hypothetical protein EOR57_23325 [Mesorhizobium sp.]RWM72613.1 MAG: hypothetical protein EOR82_14485 [Mesorhizobium sp.]TIO26893.1 MAG: hypothetical protein E5X83_06120 [Mesorhizobium sp.]TJV60330.1 MAG: hypothetical protein E5X82_12990 [Mesorhizobium sp.]